MQRPQQSRIRYGSAWLNALKPIAHGMRVAAEGCPIPARVHTGDRRVWPKVHSCATMSKQQVRRQPDMELLKQRILRDGQVKEGGVLKVDSFLNHQMDVTLLNEIGREFRRRFDGADITKIVTIEASGIGIAAIAAQHFGSVPVIFAKKTRSRNLDGALYTAKVHSFTKDITYDVQLSKKFLGPQDTVLILDDFLARGQALLGLIDIVRQAGAQCAGCGIVIEKRQQGGGALVRAAGVRLESLAVIASLENGTVTFAQ